MGRDSFDHLVSLLEQNAIFTSSGRKPQRPVRFQLGCFLLRYGVMGGDSLRVAQMMGIGAGTVFLYCRRVTCSLREIGLHVMNWGDEESRETIQQYIQEHSGLAHCLGMLDGALIHLSEVPAGSGSLFFCQKKYPAVSTYLLPVFLLI